MPESKNQPKRIRIINDCLSQRGTYWSGNRLLDKMADADLKVSMRTLRQDIQDMRINSQLQYFAPIEIDKAKGGYYYSDADYSMDKLPLNSVDIRALEMAATTLKQYQYIPLIGEFGTTIEKIIRVVNRVKRGNYETILDFIEFEKTPVAIGLEHMDELVEAIQQKRPVQLQYQSFRHDEPDPVIIHPYFIKEYRNRWYVIGLKDGAQEIRTYAFDRILSVAPSAAIYVVNNFFAHNDYLQNCIGIHQGNGQVEKVELSFEPRQGKYVLTQPLHRTQEIIRNDNQALVISLKVIVNFELINAIMGYGDAVVVLQPLHLRQTVAETAAAILKQYQS